MNKKELQAAVDALARMMADGASRQVFNEMMTAIAQSASSAGLAVPAPSGDQDLSAFTGPLLALDAQTPGFVPPRQDAKPSLPLTGRVPTPSGERPAAGGVDFQRLTGSPFMSAAEILSSIKRVTKAILEDVPTGRAQALGFQQPADPGGGQYTLETGGEGPLPPVPPVPPVEEETPITLGPVPESAKVKTSTGVLRNPISTVTPVQEIHNETVQIAKLITDVVARGDENAEADLIATYGSLEEARDRHEELVEHLETREDEKFAIEQAAEEKAVAGLARLRTPETPTQRYEPYREPQILDPTPPGPRDPRLPAPTPALAYKGQYTEVPIDPKAQRPEDYPDQYPGVGAGIVKGSPAAVRILGEFPTPTPTRDLSPRPVTADPLTDGDTVRVPPPVVAATTPGADKPQRPADYPDQYPGVGGSAVTATAGADGPAETQVGAPGGRPAKPPGWEEVYATAREVMFSKIVDTINGEMQIYLVYNRIEKPDPYGYRDTVEYEWVKGQPPPSTMKAAEDPEETPLQRRDRLKFEAWVASESYTRVVSPATQGGFGEGGPTGGGHWEPGSAQITATDLRSALKTGEFWRSSATGNYLYRAEGATEPQSVKHIYYNEPGDPGYIEGQQTVNEFRTLDPKNDPLYREPKYSGPSDFQIASAAYELGKMSPMVFNGEVIPDMFVFNDGKSLQIYNSPSAVGLEPNQIAVVTGGSLSEVGDVVAAILNGAKDKKYSLESAQGAIDGIWEIYDKAELAREQGRARDWSSQEQELDRQLERDMQTRDELIAREGYAAQLTATAATYRTQNIGYAIAPGQQYTRGKQPGGPFATVSAYTGSAYTAQPAERIPIDFQQVYSEAKEAAFSGAKTPDEETETVVTETA